MTGFPITEQSPITYSADLPEAVDVVIIGAGVIGVMSAYFLAQKGQSVLLLEKGRVAGEQSSRNWGWIRQQMRDHAELPIMVEANRIWQQLARDMGEDSLGLRRCGVSYYSNSEKAHARYQEFIPLAKSHGVESKLLTQNEISQMTPGLQTRFETVLHTPSDMSAEPWRAVPAFAELAQEAGVLIRENCAARLIEHSNGAITGVITEAGSVRANAVLVAAGAWSGRLLARLGVPIPQLSVQSNVCASAPMDHVVDASSDFGDVAARRRPDGGYTITPSDHHRVYIGPDAFRHFSKYIPQLMMNPFGRNYRLMAPRDFPDAWGNRGAWQGDEISPFERMRILNPAPMMGPLRAATKAFARHFPGAGRPEIRAAWAGMIDAMPDVVPIVDRAPHYGGLYICTGMCGHGFGIGPAFGRIMADMITGGAIGHDLARFRLGRFTDGSRLELGPGL